MTRLVIGLLPRDSIGPYARLFAALEELFPVNFEVQSPDRIGRPHAVVMLSATREEAIAAAGKGLTCLAVVAGPREGKEAAPAEVRFGDAAILPSWLRNRRLTELEGNKQEVGLVPQLGDQILAWHADQIAWLHVPATNRQGSVDLVSRPPPVPSRNSCLIEFFDRGQFLGLLPLLHFLLRVTQERSWTPRPIHACLVFDDPSLRWSSYGCLDFRRLAEHAKEWNYHAAIGIIPLDTRWVSTQAAAIFKEHTGYLSLVIHGNDHVFKELACDCSETERVARLAQALRRIEHLRRRYGLAVCQVEEPPYGIIGSDFSPALGALGYEATLITPRQFLARNRGSMPPLSFGMGAISTLPGGLGMIPRIPLALGWKTEVFLHAFLGQPVVIVGHHPDADNGLRLMRQVATTVNSIGNITWSNLSGIAQSNYEIRRDGQIMAVRMGSRKIVVSIPEGINFLVVNRPWLLNGEPEPLQCAGPAGLLAESPAEHGVSAPIPVVSGTVVKITSRAPHMIDPSEVTAPRRSPWPVIRRVLTETRDRAYPFLPRRLRLVGNVRAASLP